MEETRKQRGRLILIDVFKENRWLTFDVHNYSVPLLQGLLMVLLEIHQIRIL